jgi:hypothetical protein
MCGTTEKALKMQYKTPSARDAYMLECLLGGVCGHALINSG